MYWFLNVSAVVCHHQGGSWIRLSYLKYKSNRLYIIQCVVTWPVCRSVVVPSAVLPRLEAQHNLNYTFVFYKHYIKRKKSSAL
jgi:hypothetical protein